MELLKRTWHYWLNIVLGIILWQISVTALSFVLADSFFGLWLLSIPFTVGMLFTGALFPAILLAYREKK